LAGVGRSGDHVEEVEKHDGEGVEVAEVEADLRERHGAWRMNTRAEIVAAGVRSKISKEDGT